MMVCRQGLPDRCFLALFRHLMSSMTLKYGGNHLENINNMLLNRDGVWLFIFKDKIVLEPYYDFDCYVYDGSNWDWSVSRRTARYYIKYGMIIRTLSNYHRGYDILTSLTNVQDIRITGYQGIHELSEIHIKPDQILAEIQAFPERQKMVSFWAGDIRFIL